MKRGTVVLIGGKLFAVLTYGEYHATVRHLTGSLAGSDAHFPSEALSCASPEARGTFPERILRLRSHH